MDDGLAQAPNCPHCRAKTRSCELTAYGRCEDCYVADRPHTGNSPLWRGNQIESLRGASRRVVVGRAPY